MPTALRGHGVAASCPEELINREKLLSLHVHAKPWAWHPVGSLEQHLCVGGEGTRGQRPVQGEVSHLVRRGGGGEAQALLRHQFQQVLHRAATGGIVLVEVTGGV